MFSHWISEVLRLRDIKSRCLNVKQDRCVDTRNRAFSHWLLFTRVAHRLKHVKYHIKMDMMFKAWREMAQERGCHRDVGDEIVSRRNANVYRTVWNRWKNALLFNRVKEVGRRLRLKIGIQRWREAYSHRLQNDTMDTMARLFSKGVDNRIISGYWSVWKSRMFDMTVERSKLEIADQFYLMNHGRMEIASCWSRWLIWHSLCQIGKSVVTNCDRHVLYRVLSLWKHRLRCRVRTRVACAMAEEMRAKSLTKIAMNCFREWKEFAVRERQITTSDPRDERDALCMTIASQYHTLSVYRNSFNIWRCEISRISRVHAYITNRDESRRMAHLGRCIKNWKSKHLGPERSLKLKLGVLFRRSQLLKSSFDVWKSKMASPEEKQVIKLRKVGSWCNLFIGRRCCYEMPSLDSLFYTEYGRNGGGTMTLCKHGSPYSPWHGV